MVSAASVPSTSSMSVITVFLDTAVLPSAGLGTSPLQDSEPHSLPEPGPMSSTIRVSSAWNAARIGKGDPCHSQIDTFTPRLNVRRIICTTSASRFLGKFRRNSDAPPMQRPALALAAVQAVRCRRRRSSQLVPLKSYGTHSRSRSGRGTYSSGPERSELGGRRF